MEEDYVRTRNPHKLVTSESALPPRVFRTDSSFRNYADRSRGVLACGFILKPGVRDDIMNQVTREYVAVYVLRGRGEYVDWRGDHHPVEAGDVMQRIPGRKHSTIIDPESDWAEVYVVLNTKVFETLVSVGSLRDDVPVLHPGVHRSLVDRFEDILADLQHPEGRSPAQTLLKAHGLVLDIYALDAAKREPDRHAEMIRAARALLDGNLSKRISMPEVAASFHTSYERFRKVFKERVGTPPGEYRIRRRIESACHLLVEERLTAKRVAYELGYPDEYTFSKQFRKFIGTSPDAFRRGVR